MRDGGATQKEGPALLRAGTWETVTPEGAGWRYLSFRVLGVAARERTAIGAADEEIVAIVLSGSATIEGEAGRWWLEGRPSVFEGPPWAVYLPAGSTAAVEAVGALELAVASARSSRRGEPRLVTPDDVEVEIRGAGSATRQISHILPPAFPADRLLAVEVLTPSGNWSSYPPHKHDEDRQPDEVALEEFYYFRIRPPHGFALQRVYSPRHGFDLTAAVHEGDVVLVPFGYHVCGAPYGLDLYYLNGLAGDVRSMAASDDPSLAYIRSAWRDMAKDERLPWQGAARR